MDFVMRRMGLPGDRDAVRRLALGALALLVVAGTIVALFRAGGGHVVHRTSSNASAASSTQPKALATEATGAGTADRAAPTAGAATAAGAPSEGSVVVPAPPPVGTTPRIVRTADLSIRVKGSFADAVDRATRVATTTGGYVTSSSTSSFEKGRASGDLTLRVPSDRFDDARRALAELGTVESLQTGGEEVSGQLVDLDARLRTLQAEEGALATLLGRSTDIGQILQVRDRLTGVRTEIEQLAGQQAALRDQVALSTIHVALHEAAAKPVVKPSQHQRTGMAASISTAVDALLAVVGGIIIVLGAMLPFLVLGLLAWPVVRRYGRRAQSAA